MSLFTEILERPDVNGDPIAAGIVMGRQLMRDDPESCKAGYSADSAAIVVQEGFGLDAEQYGEVKRRLVMDELNMFEVAGFMYPNGLAQDTFVLSVRDGRTTVPLATNIQSLDIARQLRVALEGRKLARRRFDAPDPEFIIEKIGPCPVEVVE